MRGFSSPFHISMKGPFYNILLIMYLITGIIILLRRYLYMTCDNCNLLEFLFNTISSFTAVVAIIISLWHIYRENAIRINAVLAWGEATKNQPVVIVQNIGNKIAIIEKIVIYCDNKPICTQSLFNQIEMSDFSIVKANDIIRIPLDIENNLPEMRRKRTIMIKIVIKLYKGKSFIASRRYTQEEIDQLLFCCELCKEF